jgi:hypothetical protein
MSGPNLTGFRKLSVWNDKLIQCSAPNGQQYSFKFSSSANGISFLKTQFGSVVADESHVLGQYEVCCSWGVECLMIIFLYISTVHLTRAIMILSCSHMTTVVLVIAGMKISMNCFDLRLVGFLSISESRMWLEGNPHMKLGFRRQLKLIKVRIYSSCFISSFYTFQFFSDY